MKAFLAVCVLLIVTASQGLHHDGENVCSRAEERTESYLASVTKTVMVNEEVGCWDIKRNFKCLRKTPKKQTVQEKRTRTIQVPVYFCCPGSDHIGDECVQQRAPNNHWTLSASGCQCYFNKNRFDCACCIAGGCQCGDDYPDKCVQCGYGLTCLPAYDDDNLSGVDAWTLSETGCDCDGSDEPGDCPCCQHRGCQCKEGNVKRCSQCGLRQSCRFEESAP